MSNWKNSSVESGSNRSNSSNRSFKNFHSRSRSQSRSASINDKYPPQRSKRSYSRSPSVVKRKGRTNNENPEPCSCIGVFGLSKRTDERELRETFEKFGRIKTVTLIMDKYQHESLGYGFINYEDLDSATRAIKEGNGMNIDGKDIRVDYSITKKAHTPTPGTYKGKTSNRRNNGFDGNNRRRDFSDRRRSRSRSYDRRGSNRRSPPRRSPPRYSYSKPSYNRNSYNRSPPMRSFDRRSRSRSYERSNRRYH